jgi:hypothetical protein
VRCLSVVIAGASSFSPLELVLASAKKALAALYCGLQKIKRTSCPFINLPERQFALPKNSPFAGSIRASGGFVRESLERERFTQEFRVC